MVRLLLLVGLDLFDEVSTHCSPVRGNRATVVKAYIPLRLPFVRFLIVRVEISSQIVQKDLVRKQPRQHLGIEVLY